MPVDLPVRVERPAAPSLFLSTATELVAQDLPIMVMVCANCRFVASFSWLPIAEPVNDFETADTRVY